MSSGLGSGRSLAVVVTTIGNGEFLKRYAQSMREHVGPENLLFYVVADLNTPPACGAVAARLASEGMKVQFLDVEWQREFLRPFPRLDSLLRYRSDERRNVGYLKALADGADVVISIDDDNLPDAGTAFFAGHAVTGTEIEAPSTCSSTKWFNFGSLVDATDRHGQRALFYPRGFPYAQRGLDNSRVASETGRALVGINAGLWSGDPDVDAATRLVMAPIVARPSAPQGWLIGAGLRTPINTQNTSLVREAIPAYHFVRMGIEIKGIKIGRFGDIFSGYFVQLAAEAVGHRVRVGSPWVHQDRNEHRLLNDLRLELPGMDLIEDMVPMLEQPLSPATSYVEATRELIERLRRHAEGQAGGPAGAESGHFLRNTADGLSLWIDACVELAGGEQSLRARQPVEPR